MMTVVVTRDVAPRFRGFLASCMLEVAPGVYTSPTMTAGVRVRVQDVLSDWHGHLSTGHVLMTWPDPSAPGGQALWMLGWPPRELVTIDDLVLSRRGIEPEGVKEERR